MKGRLAIVVVLCALSASCDKDTSAANKWVRTTAPRLAGSDWRDPKKLAPLARPRGTCEQIVGTRDEALHVLHTDLTCIDDAIAALERLSQHRDLAAAYLIRAQVDGQPADYFRALEHADEAVRRTPRDPVAHFNRGVIQETLGLFDEAMLSYASLRGPSEWVKEAQVRYAALQRKLAAPANPDVDAFPAAAHRHFENEVLRQWATSGLDAELEQAAALASQLSRRYGDPYFDDVIRAIREGDAGQMRRGHLHFSDGRRADYGFRGDAAASYAEASRLLQPSPMRISADLAVALTALNVASIDSLEREARTAGYKTLAARIAWTRAYVLARKLDYLHAIEGYDAAIEQYRVLRDVENTLATQIRRAGVVTYAGQPELAAADLLTVARRSEKLTPRDRQNLFGETAAAATELGRLSAALHYRQRVVHALRQELASVRPADVFRLGHVQTRLGAALRSLAKTELDVGRLADARVHLQDAARYQQPIGDLEARFAEVRARELMQRSAPQAIEQFTRAIALTEPARRSDLARLHTQRAVAHRSAGRHAAARADMENALRLVQAEEKAVVRDDPGTGEPIWSGYFSRFEDTYALLIRQLVDEGKSEEAFLHAERARGFEPLHRILRLPHTPERYAGIAAARRIADIQAELPHGTFILEYSVLDDRTYVWVLWSDGIRLFPLRTTRRDVERWTEELQRAVSLSDSAGFERRLIAPYQLIDEPLTFIRQFVPSPRLVIVPDRVMQGLPIVALRNPRTRRFVIQDATIEFQGSALLYVHSRMRDRTMPRDRSVLLIANPAFDPRLPAATGLRSLPHSEAQARALKNVYGEATVRTGQDATIDEMLNHARNSAIVDFAGHAVVNPRAPHLSVLLLARVSDDDRGALEAQRLLRNARLDRTRLVVLGACSTAGGAPVGPEGVGPLVRPLIAAGVPAVVGTLWRVDDATAEALLVSFHRRFHQGSDAAVALREAQLELLGKQTKAIEWAPYQVTGHASSPFGAQAQKEEPP